MIKKKIILLIQLFGGFQTYIGLYLPPRDYSNAYIWEKYIDYLLKSHRNNKPSRYHRVGIKK
jgi:hypothetical protein